MKVTAIVLDGPRSRDAVRSQLNFTPDGYIVQFREPIRSLEQNAKMWAMLNDISRSEPLGRKHTPDDWKAIAMNACGWECQFVEGLDGRPFPVGFRSSKLTVKQMKDFIDWLQAFGDENGVRWTHREDDPR